jgi:predicted hotdog family 3-hydroxylacyl-ACP dehydratase
MESKHFVSKFPPVRDLVPHAGPMVLLDEVLAHDEHATTCAVAIAAQGLFCEPDGSVPVWIGIEYMAQCIAVHAGLVQRATGNLEPQRGFLVGARGLRFHVDRFPAEQRILATARRLWAGSSTLASFGCELRDADGGNLLAEGRLNCFVPRADTG